jgi:hypothetical protein
MQKQQERSSKRRSPGVHAGAFSCNASADGFFESADHAVLHVGKHMRVGIEGDSELEWSNISETTLGLTFFLSSVAHVGRGQIAELAVARNGDEVVLR